MNDEVVLTLDDAVAEVLGLLTGLDLTYLPELDRYRAITRALNRALRANALESEWAHYASLLSVGSAAKGIPLYPLPSSKRPRINGDDAVRLVDKDGQVMAWAYFLPRDALHKYRQRDGLWVASYGTTIEFSRPFHEWEQGMEILVPVMREPTMFRLPKSGDTVPPGIRKQEMDFAYPDVVVLRAAYYYAQSDPVMQPRVPTLENDYKNLMYQLIERDTNHTDTPFMNEFVLPVVNGLRSTSGYRSPNSNYN